MGEMESQPKEGFYCDVCDCVIKDSLNYLDHINGKRHNRNLGVSLKKFTDSTLEEVKEMLEQKKREREECFDEGTDGVDEDARLRKIKRDKKRRQRARKSGVYIDNDDDDDDTNADENEQSGEEYQQEDNDDSMAKLMGFSSFSSSKK